ncbi:MAG: ATP-dependent DNA ligase [bacterium]|nr:ATP-dependent DNA ligase [bacterium]
MPSASPDSFAALVATADAVGATRSRLEKVAAVAARLSATGDAALPVAARFFAGHAFPPTAACTTQVGPALVRQAIAALADADAAHLGARAVALGDAGDVAGEALAARPSAGLGLVAVAARLAALAAAPGTTARRALLVELLGETSGREARLLVRLLLGELRIGLKAAQVEEAIARAFGRPLADVRRATQLAGDVGEVALLARRDALATARLRLFHPLGFMLAQPLPTPDAIVAALPAPFAVEDKYDGIRVQAHVAGGRVALFSRTLDDVTARFPEVVAAVAGLGEGVVVDGELLAVDAAAPTRALPFQQLQQRLGRKAPGAALLARVPVGLAAFDLLAHAGVLVVDEPWRARRARLEALTWPAAGAWPAPVRLLSDAAGIDAAFAAARAAGNEGLIVKEAGSSYAAGRRGGAWIKLKRALATLDVVVVAVERGHGRRRAVLSDYTFAVRAGDDDPTLRVVGKAFTGLTDAEILALTARFEALTLERHGGWQRVRPEVVLEVTFDVVQPSARHDSGYALRFPRIVRVRDDKPPSEIDTLARVAALAGGR